MTPNRSHETKESTLIPTPLLRGVGVWESPRLPRPVKQGEKRAADGRRDRPRNDAHYEPVPVIRLSSTGAEAISDLLSAGQVSAVNMLVRGLTSTDCQP